MCAYSKVLLWLGCISLYIFEQNFARIAKFCHFGMVRLTASLSPSLPLSLSLPLYPCLSEILRVWPGFAILLWLGQEKREICSRPSHCKKLQTWPCALNFSHIFICKISLRERDMQPTQEGSNFCTLPFVLKL